jgi:CHAD domain-containing protein
MPPHSTLLLAEKTRNMARDECRAIGRSLGVKRRIHEGIHDARKAIRRLRALLALVETRLPETGRIDMQLERLGDGLSSLRDSHVVIETARRFAASHRKRWKPAIEALSARRDERLARLLDSDPGFLKRRALIGRLEAQLDFVDWSKLRVTDLQESIEASQQRILRAEQMAASDPSLANTHRWRRRVRRLRFQLEALAKLSPDTVRKHSRKHPKHDPKALHKLGDALGDRRDELMLEAALKRIRGLQHRPALLSQLLASRPKPPMPMAPKEYPETLLVPPVAERDILG